MATRSKYTTIFLSWLGSNPKSKEIARPTIDRASSALLLEPDAFAAPARVGAHLVRGSAAVG